MHKGNILIVDDMPENLKVLMSMLTQHGYQVRPAISGKLALTAARENAPDLILLDITMPDMDGYEVCTRLKDYEQTRDIPVIFISALNETIDKVNAFKVGGVDYVTKPFQIEEVLARVESHLALRKLQRELQQTNQELSAANAALQASNEELNAFGRTVAHDLKSPLAVVVSYANFLTDLFDELDDAEKIGRIRTMEQTARKGVDIINELMLLAGVRKQTVILEPVAMAPVVEQALKRLDLLMERHHGQVTVPDTWPMVKGYAPWLEEVWVNYLSNGLKYGGTPAQLTVGTTLKSDGMVSFWVRDNGPGIPAEEQGKLFTEFTRLSEIGTDGHGLGLSIVRRIMDKLGGQVGVESTPGTGSTFFFTLPSAD